MFPSMEKNPEGSNFCQKEQIHIEQRMWPQTCLLGEAERPLACVFYWSDILSTKRRRWKQNILNWNWSFLKISTPKLRQWLLSCDCKILFSGFDFCQIFVLTFDQCLNQLNSKDKLYFEVKHSERPSCNCFKLKLYFCLVWHVESGFHCYI